MTKDLMTEPSLAARLAATRAAGQVAASANALFAVRRVPTWAELNLSRYLTLVWISLALYFVSLGLVGVSVFGAQPFVLKQWLGVLALASLNYCVLISTACVIQHKLYGAGLQKHGAGLALLLALVLNPLVLGWLVPIFVLIGADNTRRKLINNEAATTGLRAVPPAPPAARENAGAR
jgi:hypothetical protein